MKEGYLLKEKAAQGELSQGELQKINGYTRREFKPEELYVFSVVLCDNEVDRDFECFTKDALKKLEKLFAGKTGIFDHSRQSGGQTARIYDCQVETVPGRTTKMGEPYSRLVARAYLPRTAKNEDFILELDSGIKKEVSVGCAVNRVHCSVCGADLKKEGCAHQKGKVYQGKLCCAVLEDPYDAYEWSFVAVPAQREAGVIKARQARTGELRDQAELLKAFSGGEELTLSPAECQSLGGYMARLQEKARAGELYEKELREEVVSLSLIAQPGVPMAVMESLTKRMCLEELKAFQKAFRQAKDRLLPVKPQLTPVKAEEQSQENREFKI